MKARTRLAHVVHVATISLKLVKLSAQNVQTSQDDRALRSVTVQDQQRIARSVVQLENSSILTLASADHADMDSSNPTRVHSRVKSADWDKQPDQPKLSHVLNVVTSALQACNLVSMENASLVHVELTDRKEFNQHVQLVRWVEQRQRLDQLQSKSAHCPSVRLERISIRPSMCVLNVAKDTINLNHSNQTASLVHRITAPRTLLLLRRLSAQIHVRQQRRAINIAIRMHTVFWYQKHLISSANASQDSMEQDTVVLVSFISFSIQVQIVN